MKKLSKFMTITAAAFVIGLFVPHTVAFAESDYTGSGDYGWSAGGDSYTDTPNYDYGYSTPNYDYGYNTPNYDYGYDTPNYDYGYSSPSYDSGYSTPSYTSSSGCGSSCGGGYSYTPSYTPSSGYRYIPSTPSSGGSRYVPLTGGTPNNNLSQYVSNTNTNTNIPTASNTNTITNNPTNVFNPTNNNDAHINLVVLGGSTGTNVPPSYPPTNPPHNTYLDGSCTINPSTSYVGQNVSFYATATGGSGNYTYYWTGDNGLSATGQSFTGTFQYSGYKTATVTITSNGQSITRTCSTNVLANQYTQPIVYNNSSVQPSTVTLIRQPATTGTPVAGVFLNQVPATGISLGLKMTLFILGLLIWSAFAAYIVNARKKVSLTTAGASGESMRIAAFKQANKEKKGF